MEIRYFLNKGRSFLILCASFLVLYFAALANSNAAVAGFVDGYDDYLATQAYTPFDKEPSASDAYVKAYHEGYFCSLAEYEIGWDMGYALGRTHKANGWTKKAKPLIDGLNVPENAGEALQKGILAGYQKGYDDDVTAATVAPVDLSVIPGALTADEIQKLFDQSIEDNTDLQMQFVRMKTVRQNNRCAEGVMSTISKLLGEDVKKYGNWSNLSYSNEGYPFIEINNLKSLIMRTDKFNKVDPNTPVKPFRINVITFPTMNIAHIEILGTDGKWYSDGVQLDGSYTNQPLPKIVESYDLDIEKYLGYEQSNPQPVSSYYYVDPFADFFATDPNSAPRNTLF